MGVSEAATFRAERTPGKCDCQALPQPHADRLEVLGLVTALIRLERLLPASPRPRQQVSRRYVNWYPPIMEIGHPQREPYVERERHIPALGVFLAVKVRRLGDHPPPAVGAVHIPDVMPHRADQL